MGLQESISVDFSLEAAYSSNTTFNKDFFNQLKKNKSKSLSKNSKTQKNVSLKANASKTVSLNEESFKIHEEEGAISKVHTAEEKMRDEANEIRVESVFEANQVLSQANSSDVDIRMIGGYIVITEPYKHTDTQALLKLTRDYSSSQSFELNNEATPDTFDKTGDFPVTFSNASSANGGTVIGINPQGIHRGGQLTELQFFFEWDRYVPNFDYSHNVNNNTITTSDLQFLANLLKIDSALKLVIKGHTDGSGDEDYNDGLSTARANAIKELIQQYGGSGIADNRFELEGYGEDFASSQSQEADDRKITIEIHSDTPFDYIYFEGGVIDSDATPTSASDPTKLPDTFIAINAANSAGINDDISFTYGGTAVIIRNNSVDHLASLTNEKGKIGAFYVEKYNESYYLLHEETMINYFVHSKENKNLEIKVENQAEAEIDKAKTDVYVSETKNDISKLKEQSKDFDGNKSFAISGSLDVRYARQFNMSVEGNAAVSARMISVPPPTAFEQYVQTLSGNTGADSAASPNNTNS